MKPLLRSALFGSVAFGLVAGSTFADGKEDCFMESSFSSMTVKELLDDAFDDEDFFDAEDGSEKLTSPQSFVEPARFSFVNHFFEKGIDGLAKAIQPKIENALMNHLRSEGDLVTVGGEKVIHSNMTLSSYLIKKLSGYDLSKFPLGKTIGSYGDVFLKETLDQILSEFSGSYSSVKITGDNYLTVLSGALAAALVGRASTISVPESERTVFENLQNAQADSSTKAYFKALMKREFVSFLQTVLRDTIDSLGETISDNASKAASVGAVFVPMVSSGPILPVLTACVATGIPQKYLFSRVSHSLKNFSDDVVYQNTMTARDVATLASKIGSEEQDGWEVVGKSLTEHMMDTHRALQTASETVTPKKFQKAFKNSFGFVTELPQKASSGFFGGFLKYFQS